jgi:hypothetical protein
MVGHSMCLRIRTNFITLTFAGVILAPFVEAEVPAGVEIEFAPMDMNGGDIMDLLAAAGAPPGGPKQNMRGPSRNGREAELDINMNGGDLMDLLAAAGAPPGGPKQNMRGPARNGREAELDNMLASVIGGMLGGPPGAGGLPGMPIGGGGRSSASAGMPAGLPGFTEEIVMEGPGDTQVMTLGGSPFTKKQGGRSSLPPGVVRDLFPPMGTFGDGPVIVEEGSGRGPLFGPPDPIMMDIMQDLDRSFANEMLPAIQKASSGERDPAACREDVAKKCQGAKSHLHCLGINHDSISEACRKEVGQSVPYRCSEAIDRYCDMLQTGILSCLYDRMSDLSGGCRDSVLATKHIINKVNTEKTSITDLATGAKKVNTPVAASPSDKEAKLDAKLGLTQVKTEPAAVKTEPAAVVPAKVDSPAAPISPAAALPAAPVAKALPLDADLPRSSWLDSWLPSRMSIFMLIAVVAFAAYLSTFTTYAELVRKRWVRGEMEGMKLLSTNVELPKPDSL